MTLSAEQLRTVRSVLRHLSPSSYDQFCGCPAQWAKVRIEGVRLPPGIQAHVGSGLHVAAEVSMRQKIVTGVDLPGDALADTAATAYRERVEGDGVFIPRSEREGAVQAIADGKDRAVRVARVWGADVAPEYQPAAVEERILAQRPELPIPWVGILDLRTADRRLVDWKQAGKRWISGREHHETAPTVYRELWRAEHGTEPAEIAFDVLVHQANGGAKRDRRVTARTDDDWATLQRGALVMLRMIAAGLFPPAAPGSWRCSQKWCGFWWTCEHIPERLRRLPNGKD